MQSNDPVDSDNPELARVLLEILEQLEIDDPKEDSLENLSEAQIEELMSDLDIMESDSRNDHLKYHESNSDLSLAGGNFDRPKDDIKSSIPEGDNILPEASRPIGAKMPERFLKMLKEAQVRYRKASQQDGFTAQAFDAIDAYRSANKPKHNLKRRREYAQQIEEVQVCSVRSYGEATSASRTEQNKLAQQRSRANKTAAQLASDREANKLRSRLAREAKAKAKAKITPP